MKALEVLLTILGAVVMLSMPVAMLSAGVKSGEARRACLAAGSRWVHVPSPSEFLPGGLPLQECRP